MPKEIFNQSLLPDNHCFGCGFANQEGLKMVVKTYAHNAKEDLLVEGTFKVIPLPAEKFKKVAGLEKIPENLKYILGTTG